MVNVELNGRNVGLNGTAKTLGKAGSTRKPVAKVARAKVSQLHKDRVAVAVAVGSAVSTVALSMALNTWAFTAVHGGWFGTALGVLLPLWVLALTYQAFHMRKWIASVSAQHASSCSDRWRGLRWYSSTRRRAAEA